MKLIIYSVREAEKPYINAWAKENGHEVEMVDKPLNAKTVKLAQGYDGVSIQQTAKLGDAKIYEELAAMGIKQLSTRTVGVDMINLDDCKANDIVVTNVPVYSPRAIAEMGVTQAMYLLRRIADFRERMAHGDFRWSDDLISNEIYNLTVGVIGLGNIGGATAQIYKALGARVLAYDPFYNVEYEPYVEYTDFETVVKSADILTLHTPLLPSTENMIAAPQFKMMKNNAYLINMARGGLVNTSDLIDALENHEIAGAGLDTLADETTFFSKQVSPDKIPADYKKLAAMPNVLVTPHIAFLTQTSIRNMVEISLNDVVAVVEGKHSRNEIRM
ncbi:D-2-hydroxyacid dehydrogenase [Limosilactobacillus sp. RRLNB_1_1]|uniref:D-2-hydroxyacid dehydrogenase n=1 Tax=Limosilactobacillus albertensis TaxID=2759752 RepID=A0A7W3TR75_9LACO|nr:D-2-hydroxyacid dehydrogenase [Limosilactobacillus albertensis]MBB1069427.1 D-2-hydroxyacid dehydrogenase [Limosilactobacillus albertensis]MCD7117953.1 D-2-hydroxyacid dehydrogenase [Limosilactobacillus albertensis]MCD7127793.1 D-2-hydroxyacid dehydrogenase [Limosilactobacillus albertensis]